MSILLLTNVFLYYYARSESASSTRDQLARVEALLQEGKTSTRTRDLLAEKERELESYLKKNSDTSMRTRDRLAEVEAALQAEKEANATSSRTRYQASIIQMNTCKSSFYVGTPKGCFL